MSDTKLNGDTVDEKNSTLTNNEAEGGQEKLEQYLHGWKRALADYENLKRETEKNIAGLRQFITAGNILDVLPIYDHFQLALGHIPEEHKKADWVQGIYHIQREFGDWLKSNEVEEIKALGENFDPALHEAVGFEESDQPEGVIVKQIRSGFKYNNEVIRPAQVIVSRAKKEN